MRILLVALNAKYTHTNIAIRYLRECVKDDFPLVESREFTINELIEKIQGEIYEAKAEVIGFSCYIWNITQTLAVVRRLRLVLPHVRIVLGGPEVSFDSSTILEENPEIDAIVVGEGEKSFPRLLHAWQDGKEPVEVPGLVWRDSQGKIHSNPAGQFIDMAELPNPYREDENFRGRLAYLETSRGCPFSCQYCLSSTFHGVRFLPPERFREFLRRALQAGAKTVKLVDRTFNTSKKHAFTILDIAREEAGKFPPDANIRIHCEMAGELIDEEWLNYLRDYPKDLVQFEIGVQSTNQETLDIISRPQKFQRWAGYIKELRRMDKSHLHLDLIAGLPQEDWASFRNSFNDVYKVQPHMLQLGFLKVLKGSGIRNKSEEYGLVYTPDPPYTILETGVLSHKELLKLHRLEEILERYYNSGRFENSVAYATQGFPTPFDFYHEFAEYWHDQGWFRQNWSSKALFEKFWTFMDSQDQKLPTSFDLNNFRELLRYDYYLGERPSDVPNYMLPSEDDLPPDYQKLKREIQHHPIWEEKVPVYSSMERRRWSRATAVELFQGPDPRWILFFYSGGKTLTYEFPSLEE
ncbi:MAG: B12-binding domain-containing radical SAM protein [Desulfitobacterium sp.]|nr:B12-binding domain-containing radical SAM protein [Desulfitobacterium sp.]